MIRRIPYPLPQKRKRPKSGIERAPKRIWLRHRKFVRSHACVVPGCQATDIQFCHIRSAANAGTGLKPHDAHSFPACFNHHQEQHQVGQGTFEDRHGVDLGAIAAELARRSPDTQMRLALMLEEEQAEPLMATLGPAQTGQTGRPLCEPRSRVAATSTTDAGRLGRATIPAIQPPPPFRLASTNSRLCRIVTIEGFVS